jgi:hypothetical protein
MMNFPITAQSSVGTLVDHWLHQLRAEERLDRTTINEYERVLRKLVVPRLGSIGLHELTTDRVNRLLAESTGQSLNRQRKVKVVTGAKRAANVVRTQWASAAAGKDGPSPGARGHVIDPTWQHDGRELRDSDPPDGRVGLGSRLTLGSAPLALHDGTVDPRDHPGRHILNVTRAECEHLPRTHGRPQQDLDDVADLAVRPWPGSPGSVRHCAAAFLIAAIWPIVNACGVALLRRSCDVPSTGLRAIAS